MEYTNTILIVDDSELILKVLGFVIKKAGYEVLSACDGKDALDLFDGRDIDLVFTDLNMPNMDGAELIGQIRLKEDYQYMPAVLFIPDNEKGRKEIMETSGATMLLDKNNIREKIIPTIQNLLS